MADIRKLKDQAAEHALKGRYDRAAELLSVVVAADPRDLGTKQKLGDALKRAGDRADALRIYRDVATGYAGKGELIKAIAVCKVILEIDPRHQETQAALADLYARRRLEPTRAVGSTPGAGLETCAPAPRDAGTVPPGSDATMEIELLAGGGADEEEDPPADWLETSAPRVVVPPPPPTPQRAAETPPPIRSEDLPPELARSDEGTTELSIADELEPLDDAELEEVAAPLAAAFLGATGPSPQPPAVATPGPPATAAAAPPAEDAPGDELSDEPIAIEVEPDAAPAPALPEDDEPLEAELPAVAARSPEPADAPAEAPPVAAAQPPAAATVAPPSRPVEPPRDGAPAAAVHGGSAEPAVPALPHVPLFSDLSREAFVALARRLRLRSARAGAEVLRAGDRGQSLFVVAAGRLRVEREGAEGRVVLGHVGDGEFFGEMALLSGEPRMASVVAETDCELLEIQAGVLAELCRAHRSVALSLTRFYRRRLLANVMSTSPVFRPFSPEDRSALVRRFRTREVAPGEVLVQEGKRSEGLFVVLSGRFDVVRGAPRPTRIAGLREGDLFGEISCLRRQPAAASVVARRRGIALRLPREEFAEVASSYPQVLELVSGLAEEREQSLTATTPDAAAEPARPYLV
jgi:CRP-like cAMP-binding protein